MLNYLLKPSPEPTSQSVLRNLLTSLKKVKNRTSQQPQTPNFVGRDANQNKTEKENESEEAVGCRSSSMIMLSRRITTFAPSDREKHNGDDNVDFDTTTDQLTKTSSGCAPCGIKPSHRFIPFMADCVMDWTRPSYLPRLCGLCLGMRAGTKRWNLDCACEVDIVDASDDCDLCFASTCMYF